MRKQDVINHFGSQAKLAEALTAGGFPIGQRSISDWPDPIPLDRAVQVEHITRGKETALTVDLELYKRAPEARPEEGRAAA